MIRGQVGVMPTSHQHECRFHHLPTLDHSEGRFAPHLRRLCHRRAGPKIGAQETRNRPAEAQQERQPGTGANGQMLRLTQVPNSLDQCKPKPKAFLNPIYTKRSFHLYNTPTNTLFNPTESQLIEHCSGRGGQFALLQMTK